MSEPFIVIGTGRSGTGSMVKQLVEAGVYMGEFNEEKKNYDDTIIREPLMAYWWHKKIDRSECIEQVEEILTARSQGLRPILGNPFLNRHVGPRPWGWKHAATCYIIEWVVKRYPKAVYIWCQRNKADTIASMVRKFGYARIQCEQHYEERMEALERWLPHPRIIRHIG